MSSIEGTKDLAKTSDDVKDETRERWWVEMMNVKDETLKAEHEKAENIRNEAGWNGIFGALSAAGKAI
ncbi:MAG: hypothetical protein AABZ57_05690, partial [Candidatus Margulisiibacteriota bacterium]